MAICAYNTTLRVRLARKPHLCDNCHWYPDRRRIPTIAPGHLYVIHVTFPGADGNESGRVVTHKECLRCLINRLGWDDAEWIAKPCATYCCGDIPCVRKFNHSKYGDDGHACHRCTAFDQLPVPEGAVKAQ